MVLTCRNKRYLPDYHSIFFPDSIVMCVGFPKLIGASTRGRNMTVTGIRAFFRKGLAFPSYEIEILHFDIICGLTHTVEIQRPCFINME